MATVPHVCNTATLKCAMAVPPGTSMLVVTPENRMLTSSQPAANINDHIPMKNILPFGMCKTQANPQVAAATAAAAGVLTPQPCIPLVPAPWSPGSEVSTIDGDRVLTDDSKCKCQWTGEISVSDAGTDVETD